MFLAFEVYFPAIVQQQIPSSVGAVISGAAVSAAAAAAALIKAFINTFGCAAPTTRCPS